MRKLKLQVQMSVDGYIADKNGGMDWMTWDWDDRIKEYVNSITEPVDTIVMGRHLAEGFIPAWTERLDDPESGDFARKMVDTYKVVFTRTLEQSTWKETDLAKGDLSAEINRLKEQPGSDIIAYGGGEFVSSLIQAGLIDEFHLFVNPAVLGSGMPIFQSLETRQALTLKKSIAFDCGIVVLCYELKK